MTIEEAIRAAVEDGKWHIHPSLLSGWMKEGLPAPDAVVKMALLSPDFWRCLGKAKGWKKTNYGFTLANHIGNIVYRSEGAGEWQFKMHRMIDHLADGGTITSYFKDL